MQLNKRIQDIIALMEDDQQELVNKHLLNEEPRDSPYTQSLYHKIEGITYVLDLMKTEKVQRVFLTEQQQWVYDNMLTIPLTTRSIASFCGYNTKVTSAVLRDIYNTTTLISKDSSQPRRLKWVKNNNLPL